jgi:hypothetical protein
MGFIASYRKLGALTREIDRKSDVSSCLSGMQAKMNQANQTMAAQAQRQSAASDPLSATRRVDAVATVISALATGAQVNGGAVLQLELLVILPSGVPVPVSVTELVSQLHLARTQPGSRLAVTLDPTMPAALVIDWVASVSD